MSDSYIIKQAMLEEYKDMQLWERNMALYESLNAREIV